MVEATRPLINGHALYYTTDGKRKRKLFSEVPGDTPEACFSGVSPALAPRDPHLKIALSSETFYMVVSTAY